MNKITPYFGYLFPQIELDYDLSVLFQIIRFEIVEQTAPLSDHLKQTASAVVVLFVCFEVFGQMIDARRKQRNLNLRRTGVALFSAEFAMISCLLISILSFSFFDMPSTKKSVGEIGISL